MIPILFRQATFPTWCAAIGILGAGAVPSSAQSLPPLRDRWNAESRYQLKDANGIATDVGALIADPATSSTPGTIRWHRSPTGTVATLVLPGFRPGDSDSAGGRQFLLSGEINGSGVLFHLDLSDTVPEISVLSSMTVPATDFTHLAFNSQEGRIYLFENVSGEVRSAAWTPNQALPPWGQYEFVIHGDEIALTSEPLKHTLTAYSDLATGATFHYGRSSTTRVWLRKENGVWVRSVLGLADTDPLAFRWSVRDPLLTSTDQLDVKGGAATMLEVVDAETDEVLGTFAYSPGHAWQTIDTSALGLTPGRGVFLRGSGRSDSQVFRPLFRRGIAFHTGSMSLGRGILPASRARIGEAQFGPGCKLELDPAPAAPTSVAGGLLVAVHVDGPLPIDEQNLNGDTVALLQPMGSVDLDVTVGAGRSDSGLGFPIAIPDDQTFVGTTLLFQFIGVGPDGVAVSDVFGTMINGHEQQALAGQGSTDGHDLQAQRNRAIAELLGGRLELTPAKKQDYQALRARLFHELERQRR